MAAESPRLRLQPIAAEDLVALLESEAAFQTQFGLPPRKGLREFFVSGEVSPEFVRSLQDATGTDPWHWGFAVVELQTETVIGAGGFKGEPDASGCVEIAYGIVPCCENRGYATELAAALFAFAAQDPRVELVRAHTLPHHNASTRVLEKNHFTHVGTFHDDDDGEVWRWQRPVTTQKDEDVRELQ